MKRLVHAAAGLSLMACALPAQAAVLSFDLSGLGDTFEIAGAVRGGFVADSASDGIGNVTLATDAEDYATAAASVLGGSGFGLPPTFFLFTTPVTNFFFGIDALDFVDPEIAVGEARTYGLVFAFEAEQITSDFQVDPGGAFTVFAGDVIVTRLADPVAPVPLPASLPLLLSGLGGFAFLRAHRRA